VARTVQWFALGAGAVPDTQQLMQQLVDVHNVCNGSPASPHTLEHHRSKNLSCVMTCLQDLQSL